MEYHGQREPLKRKNVDMRWPVNPACVRGVFQYAWVHTDGHMGSALDHADIRGL
jgi:hypothetical protein